MIVSIRPDPLVTKEVSIQADVFSCYITSCCNNILLIMMRCGVTSEFITNSEFADLYPVVHTTYVRQQETVVEYFRGNQLHLSGDGRCDSPEYSPKYVCHILTYGF